MLMVGIMRKPPSDSKSPESSLIFGTSMQIKEMHIQQIFIAKSVEIGAQIFGIYHC